MALKKISDLPLFTGTFAEDDLLERLPGNKIKIYLPAQLAADVVEEDAIKDGEVTFAKLAADASPHAVLATRSAVQSIPNNTQTEILWDTEAYDHGGLHDLSTNTGRLTAQKAGVYAFAFNGRFTTDATGNYREINIYKNGSGGTKLTSKTNDAGGFGEQFSLSGEIDLALNDYVNVYAKHDKGSATDIERDSDRYPNFSLRYIRPN